MSFCAVCFVKSKFLELICFLFLQGRSCRLRSKRGQFFYRKFSAIKNMETGNHSFIKTDPNFGQKMNIVRLFNIDFADFDMFDKFSTYISRDHYFLL